ncbi:hypothetical protein DPEC_G00124720 [Dallia pectoralis]|uniref:Uncharacterized protein n=1 Tax=Dallia pectoralis TaxID=75939 RepID=A0ACC2GRB7_DALPE|nr:hypothetical protein DPEC_G00124720 [Dallia pectoralis]
MRCGARRQRYEGRLPEGTLSRHLCLSYLDLCWLLFLETIGEGQVLAVLVLDRGDKSHRTPEDTRPAGKLGTSLSRPRHTLPCRWALIGPAPAHAAYFCHRQRFLRSVSANVDPTKKRGKRREGHN